ncbi:MAG: hypothetical protein V7L25_24445 [Nostoc sp.]
MSLLPIKNQKAKPKTSDFPTVNKIISLLPIKNQKAKTSLPSVKTQSKRI